MIKIVIKIPEDLYTRLFDNGVDNYDDAVNMAKAICEGTPQQPCEDCISREEVMRILKTLYEFDELKDLKAKQREVMNLPSVTPSIPDVENDFDLGYNCGYADAMYDIAESEDEE